MADLPVPPVPADCDLTGNEWYALHFKRLRLSRWWRRASDLARARNVMLWGWAYEQIPAGSLPDDDDELAEAAGFGMDADAFIRVKAEIMAPWTLCSDGRWYHPTLVEVVIEAWARTSERRKKEKAKKAAQRAKARGVPSQNASVPDEIEIVPGDTTENERDKPPYAGATSIGQDKIGKEPPQPPQGTKGDETFDEAFEAYPMQGRSSTSRPKAVEAWRTAIQSHAPGRLITAVRAYASSDYATAERGKRVPSFHRWLTEEMFVPWLPIDQDAPKAGWPGPPDIREIVVAKMLEPWAKSWLDPAGWRDLPERAVIPRSALAASRLRENVGDILADMGVSITAEEAA